MFEVCFSLETKKTLHTNIAVRCFRSEIYTWADVVPLQKYTFIPNKEDKEEDCLYFIVLKKHFKVFQNSQMVPKLNLEDP